MWYISVNKHPIDKQPTGRVKYIYGPFAVYADADAQMKKLNKDKFVAYVVVLNDPNLLD